jgi:chloramphenicol-sensitive protein RarD
VPATKNVDTKNTAKGLAYGLSAYFIWGSFPLIIAVISFISPIEIVAWRIVFGFTLAIALIALTRGWPAVWAVTKKPKMLGWIALATLFIYFNWLIYIYAVASQQIIETALGYFINPLVTILLAVVFLRERLSRFQWVAVGFGTAAVIVLSFDYGRLPWIALALAGSFGIYGLAKNKLGGKVAPLHSFAFESGMLIPLAAIQVIWIAGSAQGLKLATNGGLGTAAMVFFGFMTAVPLIFFGTAAKHLPLSYVGFLQYLTPLIQFVLALTVFHEAMPIARWAGFILVWVGLAFLGVDLAKKSRKRSQKLS